MIQTRTKSKRLRFLSALVVSSGDISDLDDWSHVDGAFFSWEHSCSDELERDDRDIEKVSH